MTSQTNFSLFWFPPFTWTEYPIIGYHAMCVNFTNQYKTKVLFDETLSNTTFRYNHVIPDGKAACSKIICNVTASNSLAESEHSEVIVEIPIGKIIEYEKKLSIYTYNEYGYISWCKYIILHSSTFL